MTVRCLVFWMELKICSSIMLTETYLKKQELKVLCQMKQFKVNLVCYYTISTLTSKIHSFCQVVINSTQPLIIETMDTIPPIQYLAILLMAPFSPNSTMANIFSSQNAAQSPEPMSRCIPPMGFPIQVGMLQVLKAYMDNLQIKNMMNPLRILLLVVGTSYTIRASHLTVAAHEQLIEPFSFEYILFMVISFSLSCFAGLCSGLTVGYMSISKSEMKLWSQSDDEEKKKMSKPILSILENHHLLLSTLLLSNALSLEALPIFLDKIVPEYLAIIISTAAVVVFGEVIPQAYCTGSNKEKIGYYLSPFVRFLQCILYPFVKPIVYLLDNAVGHEEEKIKLTRQNIKTILFMHNKQEYGYRREEIQILQNTLDLKDVQVKNVMIPLHQAFMLEKSTLVNEGLVQKLIQCNFSKIPIYENNKERVIGFIKAKNLLEFNINEAKSLEEGHVINKAVEIKQNISLLEAIDVLKSKKINFAIVMNEAGKCQGIVTLKQIFQKLVLKEFKDDDIQANIHWSKGPRMDPVIEATEQD